MAMSDKNSSLGWSPVTDGQMREFYRLKEQGNIHSQNFQSFLDNCEIFSQYVSVDIAISLLGKEKVITYKQSCKKVWHKKYSFEKPKIQYTRITLEKAAAMNKSGAADYYLIYCSGLSFEQLHNHFRNTGKERFGINTENFNWSLCEKLSGASENEAGYYLINARPMGLNTTWWEQDRYIKNDEKRCPESILIEIVHSILMMNSTESYYKNILSEYDHWGPTPLSEGAQSHLCISNSRGLKLTSLYLGNQDKKIGTFLLKKMEI
jgi:hypothetical protein